MSNVDDFIGVEEEVTDEVADPDIVNPDPVEPEEKPVEEVKAEEVTPPVVPVVPVVPEEKPVVVEERPKVDLAALQEERTRRQELQRELDALRAAQPIAPKPIEPQGSLDPNDPDPYSDMDADDIPTIGQQRKHEEWLVRENTRRAYMHDQEIARQLDEQAKEEFTEDKMGKHLDYETVCKAGTPFLTNMDKAAIRRDSNPPAKLYDLCLQRNPILGQYRELIKQQTTVAPVTPMPVTPVIPETPIRQVVTQPAPSLSQVLSKAAQVAEEFVT